jgi:glutamate N-acetyltransferase/amino-acid N-acetyltransferase
VSINGVMVCRRGAIGDPTEAAVLTSPVVTIDVDLTVGTEQATMDQRPVPHLRPRNLDLLT